MSSQPMGLKRYEFRRPDGSRITIEASSLRFAVDDVALTLSTARDITQGLRTRRELERAERSLLDSQRIAQIGSWELDLRSYQLW